MDSFDGGILFHVPLGMRQQGIRGVRAHLVLPRLGPRAHALKCECLAVPPLSVRFSPREYRNVAAAGAAAAFVITVAGIAAAAAAADAAVAAVAAAAAAAVAVCDAADAVVGPPGGDR